MNDSDVFINCPFSADYAEKFNAIVFTVIRSGFVPRCARETDDAGENRFDKICRIIKDSRYGVQDYRAMAREWILATQGAQDS